MIFDFHNDYLTYNGEKPTLKEVCLSINGGVFAVYFDGKNNPFEIAKEFLAKKPETAYLGFENIEFVNEKNIDDLISLKPIYCSLTWNFDNKFAGGCLSNGHLSKQGKNVVETLTKNGIYIDTAHLNEASFFEVASITDKILNSHCCFNEVFSHKRNISKEQIKTIINYGGLIGLTFVSSFLGGKGLKDIDRHIIYFMDNFGDKNLSVGTDFYGTFDLPEEIKDYVDINKLNLLETNSHKNLENFIKKKSE